MMNKPNIENYKSEKGSRYIQIKEFVEYNNDLEKYCNELEKELKSVKKSQELDREKELWKYREAMSRTNECVFSVMYGVK